MHLNGSITTKNQNPRPIYRSINIATFFAVVNLLRVNELHCPLASQNSVHEVILSHSFFLLTQCPAILKEIFCWKKSISSFFYYQEGFQMFLIFKQAKIYRMHRWMNEWLESRYKVILMTFLLLMSY